jgi:FHA domain
MGTDDLSTSTDPRARRRWGINDPVIRLREWASGRVHGLPDPPVPVKIGSGSGCEIRLDDPSGLLSREHASLTPVVDGWKIRDLGSKNGLRRDGERRPDFKLRPGLEITIGGLRLVAESAQLIALRALVARLLGWAPNREGAVDDALRALRDWAEHDLALVVIGDGDLTPVVDRLHRFTLGPDVPLTVYAAGDVTEALQAAQRGTLCVVAGRRADTLNVIERLHAMELRMRPQLVLCAATETQAAGLCVKWGRSAVITLPSLSQRPDEIDRIVQESALDAARDLEAPTTGFTMNDLERLQAIRFTTIAEIEETVRRIVAMRTWGVTAGAARVGITHVSLSTWARRPNRKLTT